jgi:hypothetical protein
MLCCLHPDQNLTTHVQEHLCSAVLQAVLLQPWQQHAVLDEDELSLQLLLCLLLLHGLLLLLLHGLLMWLLMWLLLPLLWLYRLQDRC